MNRDEAAHILARSLLDAGYTLNPDPRKRAIRWKDPDGFPATRAHLRLHVIRTFPGPLVDPYVPFLTTDGLWPLVDKAARTIPASP